VVAPDIQYHFLPGAVTYDGSVAIKVHGFQVHVGHNKPTSRGYVRALSSDISQHPEILFNYLQTEEDRQGFRDCVRLTREIMNQPAMDPYRGDVIQPGAEVQSDQQIDAFVRDSVDSAYHPAGTCKIGADQTAVVDANLRVRGMSNLRVIDSSVFPTVPNGNLNAPTMMVAERGADLIKGHSLKLSQPAPTYTDREWKQRQRQGAAVRRS
jgi:choline dehydrogenase